MTLEALLADRQGKDLFERLVTKGRIATLALGAFVVAADGTLLVGLLRGVAHDLSVSVGAAGQAVSVFGAGYALAGPLLVVLLRRVPQKRLLVGSLALFAASNLATGLATGLSGLLGARVLAATAAAVFTPTAAMAAAGAVRPQRSGRALSAVVSGGAAGIAAGVPAGTFVGAWFGWRIAFYALAALAVIVTVAAARLLPTTAVRSLPASAARLDARRVLMILVVTVLWALGSFTFFTYVAVVLARTASAGGTGVGLFLLIFGLSGVAGSRLAGWLTDIRGARVTLFLALATVALALTGLGLLAARADRDAFGIAGSASLLALYGLGTWAVTPPQQRRLLACGNEQRILLSLNASALYAGMALGGITGGLILSLGGSLTALCLAGAALELLALAVLARSREVTSAADSHQDTDQRATRLRLEPPSF